MAQQSTATPEFPANLTNVDISIREKAARAATRTNASGGRSSMEQSLRDHVDGLVANSGGIPAASTEQETVLEPLPARSLYHMEPNNLGTYEYEIRSHSLPSASCLKIRARCSRTIASRSCATCSAECSARRVDGPR